MEILPGEGVASATVGEHRAEVESRVGPPVHPGRDSRAVYRTRPTLVITYTDDDLVEIVELAHGGPDGAQVFLDGVQVTWRFMDEVVADLEARGHRAEPDDIGFVFPAGFAIFSTGSRGPRDLDPSAGEDDDRKVVEGVSVAPYDYFHSSTEEGYQAFVADLEAKMAAMPDSGFRRIIQEHNERRGIRTGPPQTA